MSIVKKNKKRKKEIKKVKKKIKKSEKINMIYPTPHDIDLVVARPFYVKFSLSFRRCERKYNTLISPQSKYARI